jgi:hypothetical protein
MEYILAAVGLWIPLFALAMAISVPLHRRRAAIWREADQAGLHDPYERVGSGPAMTDATPHRVPPRGRRVASKVQGVWLGVRAIAALLRSAGGDRRGASGRRMRAAQAYSSRPDTPVRLIEG